MDIYVLVFVILLFSICLLVISYISLVISQNVVLAGQAVGQLPQPVSVSGNRTPPPSDRPGRQFPGPGPSLRMQALPYILQLQSGACGTPYISHLCTGRVVLIFVQPHQLLSRQPMAAMPFAPAA